jgi:GT2 family glycosyltransferase
MRIHKNNIINKSPLTSIIILTHNGLRYTKECMFNLFQYTTGNFELIVVDNGSTDGTLEFLKTLPNARVIANQQNRGFSAGCNQGLSIAKGDYFVLLNNDTVVTKDWLTRLLWWLNHDESIGIVGPRSNFIIPQQIVSPVPYKTPEQLQPFAKEWSHQHDQQGYEVDQLSGLCMVFKKSLTDMIGGLDERFFPGYYEDTDFSIRAQIIEKKLWVANDVFIHHYGSKSFKGRRWRHEKIVNENRKKFYDKWKINDLDQIKDIVQREKPFHRDRHYIPFSKI